MASHRPFIARSLHVHCTFIARTSYVKIHTHYVFTSCKRCVKMRSFPKKVVRLIVTKRYKRYKRYTFLSKDMRFLPFLAVRSGAFRTNGKLLIGWCGANVRARPSTAGGSENGGGSTIHVRLLDRE